MSVEDCKAAKKKSQGLDESMLFILRCNSYAMQADLKKMISYAQEKYPRDIKAAYIIYCTKYSKTTKSNNNNEGNTKPNKTKMRMMTIKRIDLLLHTFQLTVLLIYWL